MVLHIAQMFQIWFETPIVRLAKKAEKVSSWNWDSENENSPLARLEDETSVEDSWLRARSIVDIYDLPVYSQLTSFVEPKLKIVILRESLLLKIEECNQLILVSPLHPMASLQYSNSLKTLISNDIPESLRLRLGPIQSAILGRKQGND